MISGIAVALAVSGWVSAQINDPEFDQALDWMYEQGVTRYDNQSAYRPDSRVTRQEASKFFYELYVAIDSDDQQEEQTPEAAELDDLLPETWRTACPFVDTVDADPSLLWHIEKSCEANLLWGHVQNGQRYFRPFATLTKAEALTVLVRILDVHQDEEETQPRWKNYFFRAQDLGLTKEQDVWSLDRPVTRYEMALMLYRAIHGGVDPQEEELGELYELLEQLGLQHS